MTSLDHPVRSLSDLTAAWQFIDGGHGYAAPQLFALLMDPDGVLVPTVIQMYDEEELPDDELFDLFVARLGEAVEEFAPGGSVAIMRARPGSSVMNDHDHAWCRALDRALGKAPFGTHPLFFATDDSVGIVPPDVLLAG